ncbi:MAG: alpha/beta fold hydrolase [Solirubrobacteraceae bacterium]|nr:alpha/beta fold hydrolase [Solirubrobacteraceae bacterium]
MSESPEISPRLYRAGQGEPLVLVHGFTATWRCWQPVLADLVPRFEVIAPTLHGHDGGPPTPDGPAHSISHAADHFEALLDEHGVTTAHFAGNSMGGALSLEMAKRGRARSVVAISPGGGWEEDDTAEPERIVRWFKRNQKLARATERHAARVMRRPGLRRLALRDVMTRGDQVPAEDAVALARSSIRCAVVDDVYATIESGGARILDLDRVACPVLIAWGDHDRILPMARHAGRFRREIPGAQFRVLAGVGHTPMWDAPGLVTSLIADFAAAAQQQEAVAG